MKFETMNETATSFWQKTGQQLVWHLSIQTRADAI